MVFSREIIEDLLTRMPVKTLMRFKCVSKDWNNYISDESFRRHYLSQEYIKSNTPRGFICHANIIDKPQVQSLYKMYYHGLNKFFYTADKYVEKEELKYLNYLSKIGYVMASSKGLLLLSHTPERFHVYDLVSKKYVSLPRNHEVKNFVSLGFNCEEKSIKHDIYHHHHLCYKVVCVLLEDEHTLRSSYNVEIYSSETSTWKKSIMKAKHCFSMRPNNIAKVIAGLFHWYELPNLTRIVAYDYDDPNGRVVTIKCPQTRNNLYHHKKLKKRKTFEGTENGSLQFIEIAEETINVWILKVKDGVNYMDEDIIYANMWNLTYSVSLVDVCSGIDSLDLEHLGKRLYIIGIDPVDLPVIYFEIEKQIFAFNYYEGKVTFVSLQEIASHFHIFVHFEWPTWPCL